MGVLSPQPAPPFEARPRHFHACHCGHCYTTIDVADEKRRIRCPGCGRSNAIPHRVTVICDRCHTSQRIRFSQRDQETHCSVCGHNLDMGAIELIPQHKHQHTQAHHHGDTDRHESIVFTILLYAIALILFLLWLGRG